MQTPSPTQASARACTRNPRGTLRPNSRPYPPAASDDADHVTYWLHTWMRATAQQAALWTFALDPGTALPVGSIVRDAFFSAVTAQQVQTAEALKELKSLGGLLFAWDGTTKLEGGAA